MDDNNLLIEAFAELAPRYEDVVDKELKKFWGFSYESFIERLLESTPVSEEEFVLDIATGTAIIPRKLAEKNDKIGQIVGLDITFDMLKGGKDKVAEGQVASRINLTCADAMCIPFCKDIFDVIFCGLAPHHMDAPRLLEEILRILKPNGRLTIADVSGSPTWQNPILRAIIRLAAFLYFLATENFARAWAEAGALSNVRSKDEWFQLLREIGYVNVSIVELRKHRSWIPSPLLIKASKTNKEKSKNVHRY